MLKIWYKLKWRVRHTWCIVWFWVHALIGWYFLIGYYKPEWTPLINTLLLEYGKNFLVYLKKATVLVYCYWYSYNSNTLKLQYIFFLYEHRLWDYQVLNISVVNLFTNLINTLQQFFFKTVVFLKPIKLYYKWVILTNPYLYLFVGFHFWFLAHLRHAVFWEWNARIKSLTLIYTWTMVIIIWQAYKYKHNINGIFILFFYPILLHLYISRFQPSREWKVSCTRAAGAWAVWALILSFFVLSGFSYAILTVLSFRKFKFTLIFFFKLYTIILILCYIRFVWLGGYKIDPRKQINSNEALNAELAKTGDQPEQKKKSKKTKETKTKEIKTKEMKTKETKINGTSNPRKN